MASMAVYDNFLTTYLVTYIPAIHVFYIDIIQPDGHSSDQNLIQFYSPCPGSSKKISEVQTYGGSRHAKQQPDQSKEQTTLIPRYCDKRTKICHIQSSTDCNSQKEKSPCLPQLVQPQFLIIPVKEKRKEIEIQMKVSQNY